MRVGERYYGLASNDKYKKILREYPIFMFKRFVQDCICFLLFAEKIIQEHCNP